VVTDKAKASGNKICFCFFDGSKLKSEIERERERERESERDRERERERDTGMVLGWETAWELRVPLAF
jgi:hypothetical protein